MPNRTTIIKIDDVPVMITGQLTVEYGSRSWVVEQAELVPQIGPSGEIGYCLSILAWLTDAPMPEGLMDEYKIAQGMPDEAAQGESDTSDIPFQA